MKKLFLIKILPTFMLLSWLFPVDGYYYNLSEGNNLLDRNQLNEAVLHYKKALSFKEDGADAYLQLGHLHLRQSLSKVALEYFKQAEQHVATFQHPSSQVELYMNMAATYNRLNLVSQEVKYLHQIIRLAENKSGEFYKKYSGKAHFLLGLIAKKKSKPEESIENFRLAVTFKFWEKTCYLYLAHYYVSKGKEENTIRLSKKKIRFFKFYHTKYQSLSSDQDEFDYLSEESTLRMAKEVDAFAKEFSTQLEQ